MPPPLDLELQLRRHGDALRRLATQLLRGPEADDAMQEVWVAALREPPPDTQSLSGWLRTVLVHVTSRWRRQHVRRVRYEQEAAARAEAVGDDPATVVARTEVARQLLAAVDALDAPYREAIWLRYFEGMAPREIAATSGVPVATVKSRLQRGLGMLRERLGERDGGDWRAGFVAAFGLGKEGTAAAVAAVATGGVLMATAMKVTAVVAACVAAAIAWMVWPAANAPAIASIASDDAAVVATAASNERPSPPADVVSRTNAIPERDSASTRAANEPKLATIRGRCVDEQGQPVVGCKIWLNGWETNQERVDAWLRDHPKPDWKNPPPLVTGADGAFVFTFWPPPPFQFAIHVDRDDLAAIGARWLAIAEGRVIDVGDLVMVPGVRVQGRVVDDAGTPIANASVHIDLGEGTGSGDLDKPSYSDTSGDTARDGSFRGSCPLRPGPFRVRVSPPDGLQQPEPFVGTLTSERPVENIVIVLQRPPEVPAITGRVVDEAGQPISEVLLDARDPEYGSCRPARTRRDGTFTLRKTAAEAGSNFWLHAEHPLFEPAKSERMHTWGSKDVVVTMPKAGGLAIHVSDENGATITDFTARVVPRNVGRWNGNDADVRARGPHAAGFAMVPGIHRGSWTVIVEWPTVAQRTSVVVPIEKTANDTLRVDVVTRANVQRTLRVVDDKGEPVVGTRVQVCLQAEGQFGRDTLVGPIERVFGIASSSPLSRALLLMESSTAADGSVVVTGPRRQPLGIRVCGPGHVPFHRADVLLDDETPLVIAVAKGARLHGTLQPAAAIAELQRRWRADRMELRLVSGASPRRMQPATWFEPGFPITADGSFDCADLEPGEWQVVMQVGGQLELGHITLRGGDATRFDPDIGFVMPGVLQGTVHKNGALLTGGAIQFRGTVAGPFAYVQGTTDSGGRFRMQTPAGSYRAVLIGPVGADRTFEWPSLEVGTVVAGQTTEQSFHVWTGELKVIVRDASGAPVPRLRVRVTSTGGERVNWLRLTDAGGATDAELVAEAVALAVLPKRLQAPEVQQQMREAAAGSAVDPVDAMFMTVGSATVVTGKPTVVELRLPPEWEK